jgi:hypothetical protein
LECGDLSPLWIHLKEKAATSRRTPNQRHRDRIRDDASQSYRAYRTSADGYIARADGDLEWLTSRPAPEGFYGMNAFMQSVDTKVLGRKTFEVSLRMGAKFDSKDRTIVFSHHPPPADAPPGVEFVNEAIGPYVSRTARATRQGHLVDGRWRDHRLVS